MKQATLSALLLLCGQTIAMAAAKPNIVIILFDDLGYGDLSCQRATDIATPSTRPPDHAASGKQLPINKKNPQ